MSDNTDWKVSPTGDLVKTAIYKCSEPNCDFRLEFEYDWKDPYLKSISSKGMKKIVRKIIRKHVKTHF